MKPALRVVTPATVNRTVTPRRRPNAEIRTREHLTEAEIEKLIKAAGKNRWGHRDATMILVAYRHGLRVSELTDLRWDQVDFDHAASACPPGQAGHPCDPSDSRRRNAGVAETAARAGAQIAVRVHVRTRLAVHHERVCQAGGARRRGAGLGFPAHPHMLRHACGFALANKGHDTRALQAYLGHKNIQHTVRYTELSPTRFKDFWK